MSECAVCIEAVPPSRRAECPYCQFVACKACTQRYLTETADDANCMSCHRAFDRDTLLRLTSRAFVDGAFKAHRERCLLERERAMVPATMPYVTQELQRRENASLLEAIHAERARLKRRIHELERAAYDVNRRGMPPLEERRAFTHKCPRDGCRGFLSSAWKCTVCEHYICSECNESKGLQRDADHVCDEGKRQTMQLIRADTKKCSGCGEFIQKVDGCDQMWCPRCGTAWSWRTGAKINGNIHNPHFYEYQRRRGGVLGRELADVPCGGMPTQRELFSALRARRGAAITEAVERRTLQLHRLVLHIDDVERGRYNAAPNEPLNRQMRVQFILDEITEDEFKRALQKQEKAQEKKYSISQVLSMFVDTISDLFRQFVVRGNISVLEEAMALVEYSNEAMLRISRQYGCVVPVVSERLIVYTTKAAPERRRASE